jgi:hypothetical protein
MEFDFRDLGEAPGVEDIALLHFSEGFTTEREDVLRSPPALFARVKEAGLSQTATDSLLLGATYVLGDDAFGYVGKAKVRNLARYLARRTIEQKPREPFRVPWFETHIPHTGSVHVRHTVAKARAGQFGMNIYGSEVGRGRRMEVSVTDDKSPLVTCHRYSAKMTGIPTRWFINGQYTDWEMRDIEYKGKHDAELNPCPTCCISPDRIDTDVNAVEPELDRRDDRAPDTIDMTRMWRKGFNFVVPIPIPHVPGAFGKISFSVTSSVTWNVTSVFPGGFRYVPYRRKTWRNSAKNFFLPMWAFE